MHALAILEWQRGLRDMDSITRDRPGEPIPWRATGPEAPKATDLTPRSGSN